MPYLLGLLGAIVTVLVLLKRLADAGIDLGGLNPFARRRRRAWQNKFEANPLFGLEAPMDAAAALAVGVAKASGDVSSEQKSAASKAYDTLRCDAGCLRPELPRLPPHIEKRPANRPHGGARADGADPSHA